MNYKEIIIIFILVVVVQQFIAWAGSCMYYIGNNRLQYAYFDFSDDSDTPMTKNILMNIFIPNIVMIGLYYFFKAKSWEYTEYIWSFTIAFFIWRACLICVLLRRREFYKVKYEFSVASVAILLSLLIYYYFLKKTKNIFITVEELREEISFAIIVILYDFIKNIIGDKVKQHDIIKDKDIEKYIRRRYIKLSRKYGKIVNSVTNDNFIKLVVYSIMILEDFNRGPLKRICEYIVFPIKKEATLGIMQVKTNKYISSKTSIQKAVELIQQLQNESNDIEELESIVYQIAINYNKDDRYAENVTFIFQKLNIYDNYEEKVDLTKNKKLVNCKNIYDFAINLDNDRIIEIEKSEKDILDGIIESRHVSVEQAGDGWEVILKDISNTEIRFNNSHIFSHHKEACVIVIQNCSNITISDVKLGHIVKIKPCCGSVVRIENSDNVLLRNVEMYGCGTYGILAQYSNIWMDNVDIHNCINGAIWCNSSSVKITNSCIHDCKKDIDNLIEVDGNLIIENTKIYNNKAKLALIKGNEENTEFKCVSIYSNKYRKNSYWDLNENQVIMRDNKLLPWD